MRSTPWSATIRPLIGEICTLRRLFGDPAARGGDPHVDLAVGYELDHVPTEVLDVLLDDVGDRLAETAGMPDLVLRDDAGALIRAFGSGGPTVTGRRSAVLAWLAGRATGAELRSSTPLPPLPRWI